MVNANDTSRTPARRTVLKTIAGVGLAANFVSNTASAETTDREVWSFTAGTGVVGRLSPTVVNDTVFIGSADNNLYAVDRETGTEQWAFETEGFPSTSPNVIDGTVFFGSLDGNVYAADAATGEQQWVFTTGNEVVPSPTVVDGTVYVASSDNNVYAIDAATGMKQWSFETDDNVFSSPTVVDGTVFVGSAVIGNAVNLYALDAKTGARKWGFETDNVVYSSPTVANGTVFFGSWDNNVYAVDADTGDEQWSYKTGGRIDSSPTVAGETVFIGSNDNKLYALDAKTGMQQWSFETGDIVTSSPTVVNNTVFVGSEDNNLYAVDVATGSQKWVFETEAVIESSPTVVDGTVYVGNNGRSPNLYAIDADVSGSSEGSRVRLKTLGHHDVNNDDDEDNDNDEEPRLFDFTIDAPSEAVAGSEVTISVDAQAVDSQLSAFQIAPAEQLDHVNDFSDLTVTTTASTQIEEPGFVVYNEVQEQVTVEWTGPISETAEAGETFTLAGDALNEAQDRQAFSHTVTVTDDPLAEYRNDNGEVDDTGLLEAISDWRDDELEDTQLLQLISEWRDAGGNMEALSTSSLPNIK